MKKRKNFPVAALRAFEAAARHGRLTRAAEELGVTHSAVSRHVSHLEDYVGTSLFEGPRNRPRLTPQGRLLGSALTGAFDQIDHAMRAVSRADGDVLDVACLGTFAMRWLIPRLQDFTAKHPQCDVRLVTDGQPDRHQSDLRIDVLPPKTAAAANTTVLFAEQFGVVVSPTAAGTLTPAQILELPLLETRTRPAAWDEWRRIIGSAQSKHGSAYRVFDHYHLTIEGALSGLGVAIVPRHLIENELNSRRLLAPWGFVDSGYAYVATLKTPTKEIAKQFTRWIALSSSPDLGQAG